MKTKGKIRCPSCKGKKIVKHGDEFICHSCGTVFIESMVDVEPLYIECVAKKKAKKNG